MPFLMKRSVIRKIWGRQILEKCSLAGTVSMDHLVEMIKDMHYQAETDSI